MLVILVINIFLVILFSLVFCENSFDILTKQFHYVSSNSFYGLDDFFGFKKDICQIFSFKDEKSMVNESLIVKEKTKEIFDVENVSKEKKKKNFLEDNKLIVVVGTVIVVCLVFWFFGGSGSDGGAIDGFESPTMGGSVNEILPNEMGLAIRKHAQIKLDPALLNLLGATFAVASQLGSTMDPSLALRLQDFQELLELLKELGFRIELIAKILEEIKQLLKREGLISNEPEYIVLIRRFKRLLNETVNLMAKIDNMFSTRIGLKMLLNEDQKKAFNRFKLLHKIHLQLQEVFDNVRFSKGLLKFFINAHFELEDVFLKSNLSLLEPIVSVITDYFQKLVHCTLNKCSGTFEEGLVKAEDLGRSGFLEVIKRDPIFFELYKDHNRLINFLRTEIYTGEISFSKVKEDFNVAIAKILKLEGGKE